VKLLGALPGLGITGKGRKPRRKVKRKAKRKTKGSRCRGVEPYTDSWYEFGCGR
jgi:hypothetical protein